MDATRFMIGASVSLATIVGLVAGAGAASAAPSATVTASDSVITATATGVAGYRYCQMVSMKTPGADPGNWNAREGTWPASIDADGTSTMVSDPLPDGPHYVYVGCADGDIEGVPLISDQLVTTPANPAGGGIDLGSVKL